MKDRVIVSGPLASRFESFSDGVFAIAITLLVLEIHLPPDPLSGWTPNEQTHALFAIWPQYLVYAVTFATVGIMWVNHNALLRHVERISHGMILANLLLLGLVCFLPFATEVVARFGLSPLAVVYYGLTLTKARVIINEVARATAIWRNIAKEVGARSAEISRMASAFEHDVNSS